MPAALNIDYADQHEASDDKPETFAQLRWRFLEAEPGSAHARHLQHLLLEAYGNPRTDKKLPLGQRTAMIIGSTAGLWVLIVVSAVAIW
jgi:hypothetical protein